MHGNDDLRRRLSVANTERRRSLISSGNIPVEGITCDELQKKRKRRPSWAPALEKIVEDRAFNDTIEIINRLPKLAATDILNNVLLPVMCQEVWASSFQPNLDITTVVAGKHWVICSFPPQYLVIDLHKDENLESISVRAEGVNCLKFEVFRFVSGTHFQKLFSVTKSSIKNPDIVVTLATSGHVIKASRIVISVSSTTQPFPVISKLQIQLSSDTTIPMLLQRSNSPTLELSMN